MFSKGVFIRLMQNLWYNSIPYFHTAKNKKRNLTPELTVVGERINTFHQYCQQAGPVPVSYRIGQEISSNLTMLVSDVKQVNDKNVILSSNGGELRLNEEEIYKVGPPAADGSLLMILDGGSELRFSPVNQNPPIPGF